MNRSTSQEKMPLLFLDEQGRSVSFDNIHSMGVVPKNLIPQSKIQLINTLLHRLEKQNELLLKQRSTKSYLGGLSDGEELDELDELITVMVNEVDFSKLSTVAKDKLINSLLRRVKKHQKLIENIKKRNLDERERLRAVELGEQKAKSAAPQPNIPKPVVDDTEVTDSFVELLSGSKAEAPTAQAQFEATPSSAVAQPQKQSASNESIVELEQPVTLTSSDTEHHNKSETSNASENQYKTQTSDTQKYADYFAEMDAQQEQRRQQAHSLLKKDFFAEENTQQKPIERSPASPSTVTPTRAPTSPIESNPAKSTLVEPQANPFQEPSPAANRHKTPPFAIDPIDEDDEDEEEDESQYLFDLGEVYEEEQGRSSKARNTIEVVMMRFGEIANVDYVPPGQVYRTSVEGKTVKLIKNGRGNSYDFFYDSRLFKGQLLKGETAQPIQLPAPNKIEKHQVPQDGVIRLDVGNVTYLLRRVSPITSPDVTVEKESNKPLYKSLLGSAVFHFLVLLLGSLFVSLQFESNKEPEPQFVSVDIQDLQPKVVAPKPPEPKPVKPVEKPKPKPVEEPKPKPKAKAQPKPTPKPAAKPKQVAKKPTATQPASTAKVNVKKSGLLASLGSPKGKQANSKQALAKVTNLNAVSSLNSQSAKTKVGGISAKVANSRVSIPTGPAVDAKGTMVSGEGRGNIAALSRGDVASGEIRGKVTANLTKKAKIGGGLSREAVKKVIDAHMAEVTYCYEKALVGNPNLSGKAVFEWKILQNGSVGQVGIQSSTLQSNKVHSCINSAIKSWKFPQPKGVSSTTVSYPFIFSMTGF